MLIVEDNPGDAELISELLEDGSPPVHVTIAEDGQEALDILWKKNAHSNDPSTDLVILDLNLPKVNGFEVLEHMKADEKLRAIPVVVMTGSLKKEDEIKARSMGAAAYCIKPATVEEMERSEMCLREHLKSVQSKGKRSGSGPSANDNWSIMPLDAGNQRPPLRNEKFIMDHLNTEPWSSWK